MTNHTAHRDQPTAHDAYYQRRVSWIDHGPLGVTIKNTLTACARPNGAEVFDNALNLTTDDARWLVESLAAHFGLFVAPQSAAPAPLDATKST